MSIRVLHLIKSLGRGGAEVLLEEGLAKADRERFEYSYGYFLPWKDAGEKPLRDLGAGVRCFNAGGTARTLLSARRVAAYLRTNGIDLVHAHLPISGVVARVAGRMAGVPVVYTEHNVMERYHPVTRRLNLATWGWQNVAIAVSGDVAESIESHAGAKVPVHTVLNGVNVSTFDPEAYSGDAVRAEYGIAPEAPVVGTVAVFRPQKRLDHWLDVAQKVAHRVPETRFVVIGDGPLRAELEAGVEARGLGESVLLVGFQEKVRPFLAAMDAYLMTSEFEGLPIALLEAMAMALPPVVTGVGGIPELVADGENGAVRRFGDTTGLADALVPFLTEPARRRRTALAARRTVVEGFSMGGMQGELESIYTRVLGAPEA
ncbi:glycosyltransferase [Rubricoccus marinus]|uniref:Glycosyltransferase subfamily 4-like N-terminal domain-containing protein n=1 Tax=Rubricoccus marinus TaxID=716817 RepID=A0A259U0E4_9BACT|nr:glycosyltransferase [Rubricoccus marinus]OZC03420.1 hypothetical protein BSZ36_10775 [Rubricoccus marinus]